VSPTGQHGGSEPSGSIKDGESLDWLSDHQLQEKHSV
jgi:hypothetical protein